jgi:hypothetical protein
MEKGPTPYASFIWQTAELDRAIVWLATRLVGEPDAPMILDEILTSLMGLRAELPQSGQCCSRARGDAVGRE